jgi:HD superfamily phosphohydrolase
MAQLVYPGAVHTRFHHALGAYHLMGCALQELKSKGIDITEEERFSAKAAILLHDVGHGPFSHALEHVLTEEFRHEELSLMLMKALNQELNGELDMALDIFTGNYPKKFLHQLINKFVICVPCYRQKPIYGFNHFLCIILNYLGHYIPLCKNIAHFEALN